MKLLAIDTSSKACSCALFSDKQLLEERYSNTGLTHSTTLLPMVQQLLQRHSTHPQQLEAFAVTVGPGSYTGLRIGMSVVKGMAFSKQCPCYGVSTLLSLAYNLPETYEGIVCAALDARVGQVFTALFSLSAGKITRLTEDLATTVAGLEVILPAGAMVVGDGAALVVQAMPHKSLLLGDAAHLLGHAASVGRAALSEGAQPIQPAALRPNYLRKSQAEREREAKNKQQETLK